MSEGRVADLHGWGVMILKVWGVIFRVGDELPLPAPRPAPWVRLRPPPPGRPRCRPRRTRCRAAPRGL